MITYTKPLVLDRLFEAAAIAVVSFFAFLCILPFIHIIALSLSSKSAIISGKVGLFPYSFTLEAYASIIKNGSVLRSVAFTSFLTIVGTVLNMFFTICLAYPLSKSRFKGKTAILSLVIATMYFSGGIIPEYILMKNLRLLDNFWVLILPGLISAWNTIILKSFFMSIPSSLEESAQIDGASYVRVLRSVVLPLSMPVLATLTLFYAVGRWNGFQDALIYIRTPILYPIQLILYQIFMSVSDAEIIREGAMVGQGQNEILVAESVKAASIIVATVPIVILYPLLQRHFISGVRLGAVKE